MTSATQPKPVTPPRALDLAAWDKELNSKSSRPNYERLTLELRAAQTKPDGMHNVELLWRYTQVTVLWNRDTTVENYNSVSSFRLRSAIAYGQRAVQLEPENVNANIWLAFAASQQLMIECNDGKPTSETITTYTKHLAVCKRLQEEHYLVQFMEAAMHVCWHQISAENKQLIAQLTSETTVPPLDKAVDKLRKVIEQRPEYVPAYTMLSTALTYLEQREEAIEIIDRAFALLILHPADQGALAVMLNIKHGLIVRMDYDRLQQLLVD